MRWFLRDILHLFHRQAIGYLSGDKKILPPNESFLQNVADTLPNLFFIPVKRCRVDVTVPSLDCPIDSLSYFFDVTLKEHLIN